jgi:hypothetical protein
MCMVFELKKNMHISKEIGDCLRLVICEHL